MNETVLINGTVLSVDAQDRAYEAVAIRNGRIAALGSSEELTYGLDPAVEVIDLQGSTVCPGFIDGHNHFSIASFEPLWIDCSTPPLTTLQEVLEKIRRETEGVVPGQWVRGWGFHYSQVPEQRNPTRWELDEACPDHPFVLMDASYHACHVNSRALEIAGIDRHAPSRGVGQIVRDDRGEPTGTLLENMGDIVQSTSWLDFVQRSPEQAVGLVEANCLRHAAKGITGVGDALVLPEAADLYWRAAEENRLPITVHQLHGGQTFFATPRLDQIGGVDMLRDALPMLRGGMLKLFMDTVYPGPAMDRCEHGIPEEHTGCNYYNRREAEDLVADAAGRGLDVAIHCLGNCAIEQALSAFVLARRSAPGRDSILRIEHFNIGTLEQTKRTAQVGAVVMAQPGFAHAWGDMYLDEWRGEGQPHLRILPFRSLLDAGAIVAGSSDYPCAPISPFEGMWSAVARLSRTGRLVDPEEAVSPREALRMYTINAALACGRADEEGSLERGKRANLAILDRNPLTCSADDLRSTVVLQTYVDGRLVFDRGTHDTEAILQPHGHHPPDSGSKA